MKVSETKWKLSSIYRMVDYTLQYGDHPVLSINHPKCNIICILDVKDCSVWKCLV